MASRAQAALLILWLTKNTPPRLKCIWYMCWHPDLPMSESKVFLIARPKKSAKNSPF